MRSVHVILKTLFGICHFLTVIHSTAVMMKLSVQNTYNRNLTRPRNFCNWVTRVTSCCFFLFHQTSVTTQSISQPRSVTHWAKHSPHPTDLTKQSAGISVNAHVCRIMFSSLKNITSFLLMWYFLWYSLCDVIRPQQWWPARTKDQSAAEVNTTLVAIKSQSQYCHMLWACSKGWEWWKA